MKKVFATGLVLVLVLVLSSLAIAEGDNEKDKKESHHGGGFPAMKDFHDVMAIIWHKHLPDKDYAALRSDVPKMAERMKALKETELPKSIKDVEAVKKQIEQMSKAVDVLVATAKETDDTKLSDAVTAVHDEFHSLVDTIHKGSQKE